MALTPEEIAELEGYEKEDAADAGSLLEASQRQHLEAQRLRRKIAKERGWTDGIDFCVLEMDRDNALVALRAPTSKEADTLGTTTPETNEEISEKFTSAVVFDVLNLPSTYSHLNSVLERWLAFKLRWTGAEAAVIYAAGDLTAGVRSRSAKK